ncbi:ATP-binding domain-containing protein [Clostridium sp.]|uniref:ATP-binding domain-containing protein n=1 Tax=Clostridium sp. TaxID=1506 RepID=UPI001B5333C4|nr:ATP-binding domain-containing protein [Clostridium sp.]MBP3916971.1 ATP-binding domain-containing protein [Clostridium sp.]
MVNICKNNNINLIYNQNCKYKKSINILLTTLSKGLEFDYVIIVNASEFENNDDRRLLYVATTRTLY